MTSKAEMIECLFGPPMQVISDCLRGFITAAPGHDLIAGDFAQIEARGVGWLCGAERLLEVFRTGADIYCTAAEDVYGRPISKVDKDERQIGKVVILACGYQGSVGAFQSMARNYGVKLPDAQVKGIVKRWRSNNSEIVNYWRECERAAISAVQRPGEVFLAGAEGREVRYLKRGSFLLCRLPSGRKLSYPYPRLTPYIWISRELGVEDEDEAKRVPAQDLGKWLARGWQQNGEPSAALHYKYVDGVTKQWTEGPTYGGSLVENITQAICRDILASALLRISQRGYAVVMHVHDEIVCEVPEGFGSVEEFEAIMAEQPAWAEGFPIKAEAWRGKRYRK